MMNTSRNARRLAATLLTLIGALACAAASAPAKAVIPDPKPVTRLVDVGGGRKLAFHIAPGRAPAILFDAGSGMDSGAWLKVLRPIYQQTGSELIAYDRAGLGDSDEDPRPFDLKRAADDLARGLDAIGVTGRFIYVAHSFAGEIATEFVRDHPGRVSRAVLVDTNVPSFFTAARIDRMVAGFPKTPDLSTKAGRTAGRMEKAAARVDAEFHDMRWPRNVPATVIVSGQTPFTSIDMRRAWIQAHRQFASAAPNRSLILAKGSSHLVMIDQPEIVSQAVVRAVEEDRKAGGG